MTWSLGRQAPSPENLTSWSDSCFVVDDLVYIICKDPVAGPSGNGWRLAWWDPVTDEWAHRPLLPTDQGYVDATYGQSYYGDGRKNPRGCKIGSKFWGATEMFLSSGGYAFHPWSFDPATGIGTRYTNPVFCNRQMFTRPVAIGSIFYFAAGQAYQDSTPGRFFGYNTVTGTWTEYDWPYTYADSESYGAPNLVEHDGYVWMFVDGCDNAGTVVPTRATLWRFNPATGTWLQRATRPNTYIGQCGFAAHDGKLFLVGGYIPKYRITSPDPYRYETEIAVFDIATNVWSLAAEELPVGAGLDLPHAAMLSTGDLVVLGGYVLHTFETVVGTTHYFNDRDEAQLNVLVQNRVMPPHKCQNDEILYVGGRNIVRFSPRKGTISSVFLASRYDAGNYSYDNPTMLHPGPGKAHIIRNPNYYFNLVGEAPPRLTPELPVQTRVGPDVNNEVHDVHWDEAHNCYWATNLYPTVLQRYSAAGVLVATHPFTSDYPYYTSSSMAFDGSRLGMAMLNNNYDSKIIVISTAALYATADGAPPPLTLWATLTGQQGIQAGQDNGAVAFTPEGDLCLHTYDYSVAYTTPPGSAYQLSFFNESGFVRDLKLPDGLETSPFNVTSQASNYGLIFFPDGRAFFGADQAFCSDEALGDTYPGAEPQNSGTGRILKQVIFQFDPCTGEGLMVPLVHEVSADYGYGFAGFTVSEGLTKLDTGAYGGFREVGCCPPKVLTSGCLKVNVGTTAAPEWWTESCDCSAVSTVAATVTNSNASPGAGEVSDVSDGSTSLAIADTLWAYASAYVSQGAGINFAVQGSGPVKKLTVRMKVRNDPSAAFQCTVNGIVYPTRIVSNTVFADQVFDLPAGTTLPLTGRLKAVRSPGDTDTAEIVFDRVSVAASTCRPLYALAENEWRQVSCFKPPPVNLVPSSSAWSPSVASEHADVVTTTYRSAPSSTRFTNPNAGSGNVVLNLGTLVPGQMYQMGCWMRAAPGQGTIRVYLEVYWFFLNDQRQLQGPVDFNSSAWTPLIGTFTAPAGAGGGSAFMLLQPYSIETAPVPLEVYVDDEFLYAL